MSKFTAGPWSEFGPMKFQVYGGDPVRRIAVLDYSQGQPAEEHFANARLIAAAPELYAALEKAQTVLRQQSIHVDPCTGESVSPLMREINAALKKARGE